MKKFERNKTSMNEEIKKGLFHLCELKTQIDIAHELQSELIDCDRFSQGLANIIDSTTEEYNKVKEKLSAMISKAEE